MNHESPGKNPISCIDPEFVLDEFENAYPGLEGSFLSHKGVFQLLIATILSAQCTDKVVNNVTHGLFKRYPGPKDLANADIKDIEKAIRPTGFYKNKAKNIMACARIIVKRFGGRVPNTMKDLLCLPGVGRKTANIVLGEGYRIVEGIAVDTHVLRLSIRLGLSDSNRPESVERDLMKRIKKASWKRVNRLLIMHGRNVCVSRHPRCGICIISDICPKRGVRPFKP